MRTFLLLSLAGLAGAGRVKNIIALMFENHSFENLLGYLPGVSGVKPSNCNVDPSTGTPICVSPKGAWVDPDPDHSVSGTAMGIFGTANPTNDQDPSEITMGGFVKAYTAATNASEGPKIMDCLDPSHVPIISTLATSFTVLDNYHAAVPGPTFPNRLFFLSGTSGGYGDNDPLQTALGWDQKSVMGAFTNLSSWRVYFNDVPSALLMDDTRAGLLTGNFKFMSAFAKDAAAGDLPEFTFVEPGFMDILGIPASDQHPAHDVRDGERLLKEVYEAVRSSPLWNQSALIMTHDEHGGFYSNLPPPTGIPNPDGKSCVGCGATKGFNFTRAGIRVPLLVISPWAAPGVPASAAGNYYEHSSLAATMMDVFPAQFPAPLTARVAYSSPLTPFFEGTPYTTPRTDCPLTLPPIPTSVTPSLVGVSREGKGPLNHLQQELILLAEAAAMEVEGTLQGLPAEQVVATINQHLEAQGALASEAAAGLYARKRLGDLMKKHTTTTTNTKE